MKLRAFIPDDLKQLLELHNKYYNEFEFPNFQKMLNSFIIEDDDDKLIMAGGVELVAESVLVTNKAMSNVKIGRALVEAQMVSLFTCRQLGIREMYAFVNNDEYAKHLIQHGFTEHGLKALSMKVP